MFLYCNMLYQVRSQYTTSIGISEWCIRHAIKSAQLHDAFSQKLTPVQNNRLKKKQCAISGLLSIFLVTHHVLCSIEISAWPIGHVLKCYITIQFQTQTPVQNNRLDKSISRDCDCVTVFVQYEGNSLKYVEKGVCPRSTVSIKQCHLNSIID